MNTLQRTSVLALSAALLFAAGSLSAQGQQKAAEVGARQFARNCAGCHGEDGRGGDKAPAIATMPSAVALSDAELFKVVHNGTRNGMPAFPQLGDTDVAAVVHYVRTLQGQTAPNNVESVTGNASSGHTLFAGKAQCSNCHRANGAGGFVASDLTAYGQSHNQDAIIKAIMAPDGLVASPPLLVEVRTKSGQRLAGTVRSEDNFNIELQSQDGRYYFFKRASLANVMYTSSSRMFHDYKAKLTDVEIKDIARYLVMTAMKAPAELPVRRRRGSVE